MIRYVFHHLMSDRLYYACLVSIERASAVLQEVHDEEEEAYDENLCEDELTEEESDLMLDAMVAIEEANEYLEEAIFSLGTACGVSLQIMPSRYE